MKKRNTTIIMVLLFFIGLITLLYPEISNHYNSKVQSKAIVDYETYLKNNEVSYEKELKNIQKYNNKLLSFTNPFIEAEDLNDTYNKLLNINSDGMIGYITINKIKVELPIFHGTDAKTLNRGVGHIEGSSLPIGGKSTHSVLSAHRGLPSSTLFSDLNKLEVGDTFTITVLNETLTYQVDKISVVKPNEISNLKIEENKDYVSLVTCTPYGINTHRLIVRGIRVENNELEHTFITTDSFKISNLIVTLVVVMLVVLICLLYIILKPLKKEIINLDVYIYPCKFKKKVKI